VVHRSPTAGGIDVSTSYYGGYVSFSTKGNAKRELVSTAARVILIDTGPKKSTAEMVGAVTALFKSRKEYAEDIFEKINSCAVKGLEALGKGDLKELGRYMTMDHELLKQLGVSSDGLDRAVRTANAEGAYGAKLSGGGGGGLAIAICGDPKGLAHKLSEAGFPSQPTSISLSGAKQYRRQRSKR